MFIEGLGLPLPHLPPCEPGGHFCIQNHQLSNGSSRPTYPLPSSQAAPSPLLICFSCFLPFCPLILPSILTSLSLSLIHAHLLLPRPTARPSLHPSLGCPEASGQEPGWLYKRSWKGDHSLLSAQLVFVWWHDCPFKRQIASAWPAICLFMEGNVLFMQIFYSNRWNSQGDISEH